VFRLRHCIQRLREHDGGNVGFAFAVALFPMVAASGAAIDYSRISSAHTRLQSALDAAVLAAAKDVMVVDTDTLKSKIETFVHANTQGAFKDPATVMMLTGSPTKLSVKGAGCIKLVFKGIVASTDPCVEVRTDAQRPTQNYIEVALVLDNSGSMAGSKIDAAKEAARSFVDNIHAGNTDPEKVKISVVPFTLTVNAGAGMNPNSDPNLDRFGTSSIHWQNLTPGGVQPAGVPSRFTLYNQLGETWGGCLEMRPGAWGLNDAPPVSTIGDSLFVPMFAPDEPGPRASGSLRQNTLNPHGGGSQWTMNNSYLNDDGSQTINYSGNTESSSTNAACPMATSPFLLPFSSPVPNWQTLNYNYRATANLCRYNLAGTAGSISARKSIAHTAGSNGAARGPNQACNAIPLQRLSKDASVAKNTINQMKADGNTNILEGIMWGWRTVSPNAPFSDGRPYNWDGGLIRNRKFVVVMTDGDNVWNSAGNPNGSIYSPFGYYTDNRLGTGINSTAQATTRMNEKTREACNNIKAVKNVHNEEAVTVITVGFSTPGQEISAAGLALLQECASMEGGKKLYYKATNATELNQVFSLIAANIGRLKLTQ
jgi:Flp pilus assembly protein TadG